MENILNIWNVKWIHLVAPTKNEVMWLCDHYDFHEIIEDDMLELNTQDKIDVYSDKYIFIVMHFPKYKENDNKYFFNEFQIILGKDFIITITKYQTNHIDQIRYEYKKELEEDPDRLKLSPYYILFMIIDMMFDKALKVINKSNKDIMVLEEELFADKWLKKSTLEKLMVKKSNIILLKHIYKPLDDILVQIQEETPKFYEEDFDVYFEDLGYKLDKIRNQISVQFENIESLSDTYNSLMNIQTNNIIRVLTIFTAMIWTMTMISGLYGMNLILPISENPHWFWIIIWVMIMAVMIMYLVFKWFRWI